MFPSGSALQRNQYPRATLAEASGLAHAGLAHAVEKPLHRLGRLIGHALPDPLQRNVRLADHHVLKVLPGLGDPAELCQRGATQALGSLVYRTSAAGTISLAGGAGGWSLGG